jgi:hypothetical protein
MKDPIATAIASAITQKKATLAAYRANATILRPLVNAVWQQLELEPTMDDPRTLWLSATGDSKRFAEIVRILAVAGFSPDTELKFQSYSCNYFSHPGTQVRVYLSYSASTCERIQIGEETVTRPVYKTVCTETDGDVTYVPASIDSSAI